MEQIKKSIREFGFNDPIAVWHDNEIVEGHGRLLAAMQMEELETVPVIRLDDLTDEQRKAYAIAHNKLTMNTDFDLDALAREIESIETLDLTDFGFNERELLELTVDDSPEDFAPAPLEGGEAASQAPSPAFSPAPAENTTSGYETPHEAAYVPNSGVSKQELDQYEERANEQLTTKRVIIIYRTEEEEALLRAILHVPAEKSMPVVVQASEITDEAAD